MRNLIANMILLLASALLFSAEDDAEWRKRTGFEPDKKAMVTFAPTDLPDLILWLDSSNGVVLDNKNQVEKWGRSIWQWQSLGGTG